MRDVSLFFLFTACVAAGALAGGPAVAQSGEWTPLGPFDGAASVLAIDPQNPAILYASASGEVFKSTDGGAHWSVAGDLDPYTDVGTLAIDPQTSTTLYAATPYQVLKSTDGGVRWKAADDGLYDVDWARKFLVPPDILTLAVDPQTPSTLYVGRSSGRGVFKSTDGGGHWSPAREGLPAFDPEVSPWVGARVDALAIDPQTPGTLYAAVCDLPESFEDVCEGALLYKSTDGGGSWSPSDDGLPRLADRVGALVIDPRAPGTLYAGTDESGVFGSTDGGGTWTAVNDGLGDLRIRALAIDPRTPGRLFAVTGGGLFRSDDGGGGWSPVGFAARDLAIDPLNPSTLYAGTGGGLSKSTDGGASWTSIDEGLANSRSVRALAIDRRAPGALYAVTGGVYKSTDRGAHWTAVNEGLTRGASTLVIDPQTPGTLYAGTGGGVFKSTDGGGHWTAVNEDLNVEALAIDPHDPGTLYAGNFDGVFKSTDGGVQWSAAGDGLPADLMPSVQALAIDPQTPGTLYAGTSHGLYKSTDGGGLWSAAHDGLTQDPDYAWVMFLEIDPQTPSTLFAGVLDPDIADCGPCALLYRSDDGGGHWELAHDGLPEYSFVAALAFDARSPDTVYVGLLYNGPVASSVYRSTDGGPWSALGLERSGIHALAVDPATPATLFAGTMGHGVFGLQLEADPGGGDPGGDDPSVLPLQGGRFEVTVDWRDFEGGTGVGRVADVGGESDDSGIFYFFQEDNWELLVKVIDGCGFNGRYWVYAAATTNVEYTLTVTDTEADEVKTYANPLGRAAAAVTDSAAFDTCP